MTGAVMTGAEMTRLFCGGHFDTGCFVVAILTGAVLWGPFVGADLSWAVLTVYHKNYNFNLDTSKYMPISSIIIINRIPSWMIVLSQTASVKKFRIDMDGLLCRI